ncbi:MAG: glycosyltransferase [Sphingobacteriales bacterium]|nr:glycosyltransferase [Sphingobacteriales bacterium]
MSEKIIFTVTNDLVFDRRMHRICSALQQNGFFVELVGRIQKDSEPVGHFPFLQTRLKCFFNKGFLFYAEFNIRLFFFLLLNQFDMICSCDLDTLPAGVLAGKLKRKKRVYDAHEYFPESPELIGKSFKQSFWHLMEKLLVPNTDAHYTVTQSIADLFNKKYHTGCKVIRNLPHKCKTAVPMKDTGHPTYLLYQGAVNIGRGLNEMLLAMLKIDGIPFYIAGDGDEMQYVTASIQKLKLQQKVKLLGKQTPDKLKAITEQAYIGINLLENRGLSYYYSLGNKTFDYIQAGIPQILIGFPEYIELNRQYQIGLIVDELSVEKIETAIRKLLNDRELYGQLHQNCLKAAAELNWEKEQPKLLEIYKNLTRNA